MSRTHAGFSILIGLMMVGACQPKESPAPPAQSASTSATPAGVNERLITAAALVALPPPGITPADLPDPQTAGAHTVAQYCSICHNIPSPTAHSATDWPSVTRRMWLRMDLLPPDLGVRAPSMAERQTILAYLLDNALKVSGTNLPDAPGRAAFSETCSRCHALPDPRQHSPADWPAVVLRMGQVMDQMKVNRPTPEATQQVVMYLQRVTSKKS